MDSHFKSFPRHFFSAPAADLAPRLLGHWLLTRVAGRLCGGRMVEVEAYHEGDAASHSHRGPTERNRAMFGPPGHAYVYLSYGVHHCVNVVCGSEGVGEAVLIRALVPEFGVETMMRRRGVSDLSKLLSGPGKIGQALAIDRKQDHADLCAADSAIFIARAPDAEAFVSAHGSVATSPRIGITKAADLPLRFFLRGNQHLSRR